MEDGEAPSVRQRAHQTVAFRRGPSAALPLRRPGLSRWRRSSRRRIITDYPLRGPFSHEAVPGMTDRESDRLTLIRAALADRYTVEDEIGRGGMAIVYRANDRKHDRPVAV